MLPSMDMYLSIFCLKLSIGETVGFNQESCGPMFSSFYSRKLQLCQIFFSKLTACEKMYFSLLETTTACPCMVLRSGVLKATYTLGKHL
jgi:hypothetical protein